ncbi:hypothetical protein [Mesorhizobium sp.]|uniref:hypothetical protein n=1 Tax=Mesorhizobium sp. TaxID=1871066 RepID=UPI0025C053A4|nr:hypothetical protein [Mesorhizobium sp.]
MSADTAFMGWSHLTALPSRLQIRGEALQIDDDRFLWRCLHSTTIDACSQIFLCRTDAGEQHHRVRRCEHRTQQLLVDLRHLGMGQYTLDRRRWRIIALDCQAK